METIKDFVYRNVAMFNVIRIKKPSLSHIKAGILFEFNKYIKKYFEEYDLEVKDGTIVSYPKTIKFASTLEDFTSEFYNEIETQQQTEDEKQLYGDNSELYMYLKTLVQSNKHIYEIN